MVDEEICVPTGVMIAAVVLGLMAILGLLFVACTAFVLFVTHNPLIPRIPVVRLAVAGLGILVLAVVILAGFTIVGLLRLKIWARYSIAVLGLLDFVAFGLTAVTVLIGRVKSGLAAMPIPNHPTVTLGDIMLVIAAVYAVLALIGVWWMIYFNAKPVRLAFAEAEARLTP